MGRIHYNSKDAYKDVVIELTKDITLDYLIHYAAPYTGSGRTTMPKGTRFQLHQHMNDYCFYAHTINSNLEKKLWQKGHSGQLLTDEQADKIYDILRGVKTIC